MAAYPPEDRVDHPDLQSPPTERLVPDTDRALPTARNTVLVLSMITTVLVVAAVAAAYAADRKTIGLVLAIVAFIVALLAVWMSYGDARSGMATPIIAAITAGVIGAILLIDITGADERARRAGDNLAPTITGTPATVPADPADIIENKPKDNPPGP